jgi:hypothetical protein
LISRNGNPFASFADLATDIAAAVPNTQLNVRDGEIVCVDKKGRPQFRELFGTPALPDVRNWKKHLRLYESPRRGFFYVDTAAYFHRSFFRFELGVTITGLRLRTVVVFGCVEVLTFMQGETAERWRTLCAQAALEQDVDKLIELTQEICRLLQEKEQRLRQRQSPESADAVA